MQESYAVSGSVDTAKEEINGWSLGKALHDNGFINLLDSDYKKIEENIKMYENKLQKINDFKEPK